MRNLLATTGLVALAVGSLSATAQASDFSPQNLHVDPLNLHVDPLNLHVDPLNLHVDPLNLHVDPLNLHVDPLNLHVDPLQVVFGTRIFSANNLHVDPLNLHVDPLNLHVDPLNLHVDPLNLHVDPLNLHVDPLNLHVDPLNLHVDPLNIHVDPLNLHVDPLVLGALAMHWDSLSGNEVMLAGQADLFWGTFRPSNLHVDPLNLHVDPLNLHVDPLNLHVDPLNLHVDPLNLHVDPLNLHVDPLNLHVDPLNLHVDPLTLFIDPAMRLGAVSLWIDPLNLHVDPLNLHVDPLNLHVDPLAVQLKALALHLDALNIHVDPLNLHVDPLNLHVDPLVLQSLLALETISDPSQVSNLASVIDPLQNLGALADQLDLLAAQVESLDLGTLNLHVDPLAYAQIEAIVGALGGIEGLSAQLRQIGDFAVAVSGAYDQFQDLYARADARYGELIANETGQGFGEGFLDGFLAKHGMSGDGFVDFLRMSEGERNAFLIDFNDQLFTFLGVDHPDHWMSAVNWSPRLSEVAGYGEGVTIGVVDQAFEGTGALASAPTVFGPVVEGQDHGRAVTGVLAGALDGEGVMGVAPEASIVLANPFNAEAEADEKTVMEAITRVGRSGASIINLSLGEEGATFAEGWNEVFQNGRVKAATKDALFVIAAGNTGVTQEYDVDMSGTNAVDRIILVGAIDPTGEIAGFSNTPGDACFTYQGGCTPMMERFLVAPGQQILVSTPDGIGRTSGTSFATPIVSGAAALLQSRWEWLADRPEATAEILFRSADDLGAPGVDEVYGWGLLNVSASQRPLDFDALTFRTRRGEVSILDAGLTPRLMARVTRGDTLTVFETVGDTYRDFEIPVGVLEAGVIDPRVTLENAAEAYFGDRVGASSGANQAVAGLNVSAAGHFTDVAAKQAVAFGGEEAGWTLSLEAREPSHGLVVPEGDLGFQTHGTLAAEESGLTLRFGHGDGAVAFGGQAFGLTSDHDVLTGGVNPMLGLASGGAYFMAELPLTERLTLSGGVSGRDQADLVLNPFSGELTERVAGTEGYSAAAANAGIAYAVTDQLSLNMSFTALSETDGFLGGQSVGALQFGERAESRSLTVGFNSDLAFGFDLAVSATVGRTTGGTDTDGILAVGQDGVVSTSYQAALGKQGIFGDNDRLRLSFAQPLHVEDGTLEVRSLSVVDRATGALGLQPNLIGLDQGERRYVGEMIYGRSLLEGRAELSLFGQVDTSPLLSPGEAATSGGLRFTIGF